MQEKRLNVYDPCRVAQTEHATRHGSPHRAIAGCGGFSRCNMEIWKDIKGFEGYYQVSNQGNVRSLDRIVENGGRLITRKGQVLCKGLSSYGYYHVVLSKGGKHKNFRVNRLVAEAFVPNPNNYPHVNHKNEIKTDNRAENLEWCTGQYNHNYGTIKKRISDSGRNCKVKSKRVAQIDLQGNIVAVFPSTMEVQRQLGYSNGNISNCCVGRIERAYGYKWKYL